MLFKNENNKFLILNSENQNEQMGFLAFEIKNGGLYINSVFVNEKYRGQNLGGQLIKHAINFASEKDLIVVPVCPFAVKILKK